MAEIEKKTLMNDKVDDWISSLYTNEDAFFEMTYAEKTLKFKKRFPMKIGFQMQNKSQEDQMFELISLLSVQPAITVDQAKRLPQDFFMAFAVSIKEYFDMNQIKKGLPPAP